MLKSLEVRNYALIDEVRVEFDSGLNIITGETGAGKSIILGAISLLLGERAALDSVRRREEKAVVEGYFDVSHNEGVDRVLREHDYDESGGTLILRREIVQDRGSRAFVNDSPAQLGLLRELGELLVDLHGQHDHQSLLRPDAHRRLLDEAIGTIPELEAYRSARHDLIEANEELDQLRSREQELIQKREFFAFQLREIEEIDPKENEDVEIETELDRLEHAEEIQALAEETSERLTGAESASELLGRARKALERLAQFEERAEPLLEELKSAAVIVEEVGKEIGRIGVGVDLSPTRLDELRRRAATLSGLRKKYGPSLDAVLEHADRAKSELELAEGFGEKIEELEETRESLRTRAAKAAMALSKLRRERSAALAEEVERHLHGLGIEDARFRIRIEPVGADVEDSLSLPCGKEVCRAMEHGIDQVGFDISTNRGEDLRPLSRTASGGEISRVMLALKSVLAKSDSLPIMIFDEIDTGISGRIASKVGQSMLRLANDLQIIAITHLPQIAAISRHHFLVEKRQHHRRTVSSIRRLDLEEHHQEVARLMSGEDVTESSLEMARELIERADA